MLLPPAVRRYFPDEAPLDERLKNVGLAQALLSFGDRFTRRHAEGEGRNIRQDRVVVVFLAAKIELLVQARVKVLVRLYRVLHVAGLDFC